MPSVARPTVCGVPKRPCPDADSIHRFTGTTPWCRIQSSAFRFAEFTPSVKDFAVLRARLAVTLFLAFVCTGFSTSAMADSPVVKATLGWQ
ncbi:hypothetical protein OG462_32865 [Streptomyces sp. NBC_01077]|uniref:hypothetical protein n=1 Tax=Streptomyces sp. NBC_01077 TaxID=2903746 RepID=UPI00386C2F25|nr:hypothetical protein OG462_32865 [Streptomyces sp. NBC_01077]